MLNMGRVRLTTLLVSAGQVVQTLRSYHSKKRYKKDNRACIENRHWIIRD